MADEFAGLPESDFAAFLEPSRWDAVERAIHAVRERTSVRRLMSEFHRHLATGALGIEPPLTQGDINIVGQRYPQGKVMTQMVEALRVRRESYYGRRRIPVPTAPGAIPPHDKEEAALFDAIMVTLDYADGGPEPLGFFDREIDAVAKAVVDVENVIEASIGAVEKIRAATEAAGRLPVAAYLALVALKAAEVALSTWPLDPHPTASTERECEVERVVGVLEKVTPQLPRKLIAKWLTEVGLAKFNENSLNTVIHRIRKSGGKLPRRKKHTFTD